MSSNLNYFICYDVVVFLGICFGLSICFYHAPVLFKSLQRRQIPQLLIINEYENYTTMNIQLLISKIGVTPAKLYSENFLKQRRCFIAAPICGTQSSFYTIINEIQTAVLPEHTHTIMGCDKWLVSVRWFSY